MDARASVAGPSRVVRPATLFMDVVVVVVMVVVALVLVMVVTMVIVVIEEI